MMLPHVALGNVSNLGHLHVSACSSQPDGLFAPPIESPCDEAMTMQCAKFHISDVPEVGHPTWCEENILV
jgi:hypothetical protein